MWAFVCTFIGKQGKKDAQDYTGVQKRFRNFKQLKINRWLTVCVSALSRRQQGFKSSLGRQ